VRRRHLRTSRAAAAVAVALLSVAAMSAAAPSRVQAAGDSTSGVVFFSIRVAPDYATSHAIYASGSQLGCQSACTRLFRSTDGGHTWHRAAASGWRNGDALPAVSSRGPVLVSSGPQTTQDSWDLGEHFTTLSAPAGSIDVTSTGAGGARAIVVDSNDHWHVIGLTNGGVQDVSGATGSIKGGSGHFVAPGAAGGIAAFASGQSATTGHPAVARCTADWHCDAPSDIASNSDSLLVQPSPAFVSDRAVFARSAQHGLLYRSLDAGHSFTAITVAPASSSDVSTSLQGLAFSGDFDAAAPRGRAYAAVLGVASSAGAAAELVGGVYLSTNGGSSWGRFGPGSALDHGAIAIAATPDGHVLAAYFDAQHNSAGLLCTTDGSAWSAACPASAAGSGGTNGGGSPGSSNGSGSRGAAVGSPAPGLGSAGAPAGGEAGASAGASGGGAAASGTATGANDAGGGGFPASTVAVVLAVLAIGGLYVWVRQVRSRQSA
jgi:hypothetical protein